MKQKSLLIWEINFWRMDTNCS